jgi:LCP family protein required for cell wall assembly
VVNHARRRRRGGRTPRWAKLCAIIGAVLVVLSGGSLVTGELLLARYEGAVGNADLFGDQAGAAAKPKASTLKGPLTVLLVGIDPRANQPNEPPRSDSIIVLNVPAGLDRAYLFSVPRDLVVNIPAFPKANFAGSTEKINAAMAYGSRVPGQAKPDPARGFELLSKTVSAYTGIQRFDAGAIINFTGFKKIVDAMGGVDLYVDEKTKSEHLQPDGSGRTGNPNGQGYIGPQKVYTVGKHHLAGWEALDYVRQRHGLVGSDYARQRHQQQFIKAMVDQAFSADVVTNPIKLDRVLRAAGQSLTFSGRGRGVLDWALALKNIRSSSLTTVKLAGSGVTQNGQYKGERLAPIAQEFFASVRNETVDTFLANHPEMINTSK